MHANRSNFFCPNRYGAAPAAIVMLVVPVGFHIHAMHLKVAGAAIEGRRAAEDVLEVAKVAQPVCACAPCMRKSEPLSLLSASTFSHNGLRERTTIRQACSLVDAVSLGHAQHDTRHDCSTVFMSWSASQELSFTKHTTPTSSPHIHHAVRSDLPRADFIRRRQWPNSAGLKPSACEQRSMASR